LAGEPTARPALVATPVDVHALETLQTRLDAAADREDYDRVEQLNFEFYRTTYRLAHRRGPHPECFGVDHDCGARTT